VERPCPVVTQEAYLTSLGLGLSKAALRKKLQVLALSAEAQAALADLPLTAAAIRAMLHLDSSDQDALLAAVHTDPRLATQVRSIVQSVTAKGRSIDDALAIAQGRVPGMDAAMRAADPESADPTAKLSSSPTPPHRWPVAPTSRPPPIWCCRSMKPPRPWQRSSRRCWPPVARRGSPHYPIPGICLPKKPSTPSVPF